MDIFWSCIKAFLVGGTICMAGQLLLDYTRLTPAKILFSFVICGVILGGLGLYQPLVDFAGSGASVPLTGFGNLLAQGVKQAVNEKGAAGIFTGGLTAASGGISAAVGFSLLTAMFFRPKDKNQ